MTKTKHQPQSSNAGVYIGICGNGMFWKHTKPTGSVHKTKKGSSMDFRGFAITMEGHSGSPQDRVNVL